MRCASVGRTEMGRRNVSTGADFQCTEKWLYHGTQSLQTCSGTLTAMSRRGGTQIRKPAEHRGISAGLLGALPVGIPRAIGVGKACLATLLFLLCYSRLLSS